MSAAPRQIRSAVLLCTALLLVACGQQGGLRYGGQPYGEIGPSGIGAVPQRYYAPPGPPDDPWGPYIREAATRYGVPEQWVRAVMQQESGGEEQAVSPVGAMGLMQVMPETYADLRARYGLGADPFDPHDNILAGTAYIREMYDLFGSPGFLAAYNAGPDRVDDYLAGAARLPNETMNYLAMVSPNLGNAVPPSGPLAAYASTRPRRRFVGATVATLAAGCDLDAAYDPNHPCSSLEEAAAAPSDESLADPTGVGGCNLDAAYDPSHPCTSVPQAAAAAAPQVVASVPTQDTATAPPPAIELAAAEGCEPSSAYDADRPCHAPFATENAAARRHPAAPVAAVDHPILHRFEPHRRPIMAAREWSIQVGAFANPALARAVAEGARHQAPKELRYAALALPPTSYRHGVLYRARLAHLSAKAAAAACTNLNRRQLPCIVVRPSRT